MKKQSTKRQLNNRASVTLAIGVKLARNFQEISKNRLAELAGCSPQYVTDVEGQSCNPRQSLITDLADALGRTPAELYQLGELELEQRTTDIARERQQRTRSRKDLGVILDALEHLGRRDLKTLAEATQKRLAD